MQTFKAFLVLFTLLALEVPAIKAQVLYGSIIGTVTDPSGAVVPKAEVNAVNPETGETRNAITDDAGRYTIGNVVPGTYEIHVSAPGFSKIAASNVVATINTVTRFDVQLQVGSQAQAIDVSASAATLQTEKGDTHSELGHVLPEQVDPPACGAH